MVKLAERWGVPSRTSADAMFSIILERSSAIWNSTWVSRSSKLAARKVGGSSKLRMYIANRGGPSGLPHRVASDPLYSSYGCIVRLRRFGGMGRRAPMFSRAGWWFPSKYPSLSIPRPMSAFVLKLIAALFFLYVAVLECRNVYSVSTRVAFSFTKSNGRPPTPRRRITLVLSFVDSQLTFWLISQRGLT